MTVSYLTNVEFQTRAIAMRNDHHIEATLPVKAGFRGETGQGAGTLLPLFLELQERQ